MAKQQEKELEPKAQGEAAEVKKKRKRGGDGLRTFLRVIIWIVIIAAAIWGTLFLASKIAQFDSIASMLEYIKAQF